MFVGKIIFAEPVPEPINEYASVMLSVDVKVFEPFDIVITLFAEFKLMFPLFKFRLFVPVNVKSPVIEYEIPEFTVIPAAEASKVVPLEIVKVPEVPKALLCPTFKIPVDNVTPPEFVLFPERITDPVEEFTIVSKLLPEISPEQVKLLVDDVPI